MADSIRYETLTETDACNKPEFLIAKICNIRCMMPATKPHMIQNINSFIRSHLKGFQTTVTSFRSPAGHIEQQENILLLMMILLFIDAVSSFLLQCMAKYSTGYSPVDSCSAFNNGLLRLWDTTFHGIWK